MATTLPKLVPNQLSYPRKSLHAGFANERMIGDNAWPLKRNDQATSADQVSAGAQVARDDPASTRARRKRNNNKANVACSPTGAQASTGARASRAADQIRPVGFRSLCITANPGHSTSVTGLNRAILPHCTHVGFQPDRAALGKNATDVGNAFNFDQSAHARNFRSVPKASECIAAIADVIIDHRQLAFPDSLFAMRPD